MAERLAQLRQIVEDASELAPRDRSAFLAEACGDDEGMLREAEALLAAGLETDGFLEPLVGEEAHVATGTEIGPFRIVRQLGRGGMGTVFEAHQASPARTVALKIMRDALTTQASRERFRYEVDALGALNHPGIAQIFQAGIHQEEDLSGKRELPWFAMEYVADAQPLSDYARAAGLDRDARVGLVATVAEAVHHGHQKGVIHRDLKPDNLLVGSDGTSKVIDFGVARFADADRRWTTIQTESREIVGTLAYMSPEQTRGNAADVRSDVYALGVVLYELLAGRLPIEVDAHDFLTSARRINESPPSRPSAVRPELKGDVEAILLRALEKEPERRYASVAAFAEDLRRYLRREPVEARVPSAWSQLRSFARRNRPLVAAGASSVVVLVAAAAVSLSFAMRSKDAERHANKKSAEAEVERDRANELLQGALGRNVKATFQAVPRMHELPGGAKVAVEVMQTTIADLEALRESSGGAPAVQLALAEAQRKLGDALGNPIYRNVGDEDGAKNAYTRALELAEPFHQHPRHRRQAVLVSGRVLRKQGEIRGRRSTDEQGARYLERARDLLDPLALELPDDEQVRTHAALVHVHLGYSYMRGGDLDRAAKHGREGIQRFETVWADFPERVLNAQLLAQALHWQARTLVHRKELDAAAKAQDRAITLVESVQERAEQPEQTAGFLAVIRQARGAVAMRMQDYDVADPMLERAKDRAIELARADPSDARRRVGVCTALMDWVIVAERRAGPTEDGLPPAAARERALEAAEVISQVAPDANSKMVTIFGAQLRAYAAGKAPAGSLMSSFGK